AKMKKKASNILSELEVNIPLDKTMKALSVGEQQLIEIAKTLMNNAEVIIMDEPFSALDPISREKLQDDLIELQTKIKKTIVFVTHDIQEAMKLGDRICLLNDGRVEQIDTPEGFQEHPKNQFVREFMGDHLHKDINNSKISDLNLTRTLTEYDEKQGYPIIKDSMKLQDIYEILAKHEAVIVENNHALTQSLLRREDVFDYLSKNDKEG
ncbi:MAG: ATP-binding cassette domain-containing protein, partial [Staphylococcus hominis]